MAGKAVTGYDFSARLGEIAAARAYLDQAERHIRAARGRAEGRERIEAASRRFIEDSLNAGEERIEAAVKMLAD